MTGPKPYRPDNPFAPKAYRPDNPFAQPEPTGDTFAGGGAGRSFETNKPLTVGQGAMAGARAGLGLFTKMLTGVPAPTLADQLQHERGQVSGVDFANQMRTSAVPFGDYGDAAGRYANSLLRQAITGESDRDLSDLVTGKRGGFGGALDEVRADQDRFAREAPGASTAATIAGTVGGGFVLPAPKAAPGLLGLGKDVLYGTGLGAAYAAGEAPEGEMLSRATEGGVWGAVGTAAISGGIRGTGALLRRFRGAPPAPVVPEAAATARMASRDRYAELRSRAQAVTRDLPPAPPEVAAEVERVLPDPFPDQTGAWQREAVESAPLPASKPVTLTPVTPDAPAPRVPVPMEAPAGTTATAPLKRGKALTEQPTDAVLAALKRNIDALQNQNISPAQWSKENNWGEMVSPSGGGIGAYILETAQRRADDYLAELARRGIGEDEAFRLLDDLAERGAIQATEAGAPMRPRAGSPMSGDVPFSPDAGVGRPEILSGIVGSGLGGTGGIMAGGAIGGRIGDTPEERERNRGRGQVLGGIAGALLGGTAGLNAIPAVQSMVGARAGIAVSPGTTAALNATRGDEALVSLIERNNLTPDDLERTLRIRRAIGGADRTTIADLDEGLRGAARNVSAHPAGQGLKTTMRDRAQQVGRDAMANVRRLLGIPTHMDVPAYQAEIIQRAQATIGPEFEKVFASSPRVNTPELAAVVNRPAVKKAWALFAENEANAGREVPALFDGDTFNGLDLRTLARLKESLDGYLFTGERGGDLARGIPKLDRNSAAWKGVNEARKALLDLSETQFGPSGEAYKALRGQYAGEFELKRAAGLGEAILNPKVSPETYGRRVGTMRAEEREAFRVGVARAVEKRLGRFLKASTDAERIQIQQEALGRLKAALGDDPLFAQVQQAFENAKEQTLTNTAILNRSTTADALLGNQQLGQVWNAIRNPTETAWKIMAKIGVDRYNEAEARRLAAQMGASGKELDQIMADVRRLWAQRQGIRGLAGSASRAAAASAGVGAGRRP